MTQPLGSRFITNPSSLLRVAPPLPWPSVLALMVVTTCGVPLACHGRFSCSASGPAMSSCRLYAGCRVVRKQVAPTLIREEWAASRFGSVCNPFRRVSNGSLALTFSSLTSRIESAVSPSLTTTSFECSSMGWFEISPCRPISGGQTPIPEAVTSALDVKADS
jgi:hypothetical protein